MKKKILFFINTLNGGGAEKVLVDLVNNLDKDKYDVTVQTIFNIGVYQNSLDKSIRYKTIFSKYNRIVAYIFIKLIYYKIGLRHIYKKYINDNYDIEVAFLEGVPTKLLSISPNPNKYAWVHIDLYNYYGHEKIFRNVEENSVCYQRYKKIICVSESAKKGFKRRFGFDDNVIVQYNPVDEKKIIELAEENVDEISISDRLKIITVGRLTKQKGYDRLLNVVNRLKNEGFDFELWILGEGEDRVLLEGIIREKDLGSCVTLYGFQRNPYKFMRSADLFVCSSIAEGFSTVVTEATILGLPTVTTDCSGMVEIFGDQEYGMIVNNSVEGLYGGLKKMLTDKKLIEFYRTKALERGKMFKLNKTIKDLEGIFWG